MWPELGGVDPREPAGLMAVEEGAREGAQGVHWSKQSGEVVRREQLTCTALSRERRVGEQLAGGWGARGGEVGGVAALP